MEKMSSASKVYGVTFQTAHVSNIKSVSRSDSIDRMERKLIYSETTLSRPKAYTFKEYGHGFYSENSNDK